MAPSVSDKIFSATDRRSVRALLMQRTQHPTSIRKCAYFWAILAIGCGRAEPPDPELKGLGGASHRWPEEITDQEEGPGENDDEANPWLNFGTTESSVGGGAPSITPDGAASASSGGMTGQVTPALSSIGGAPDSNPDENPSAVAVVGGTSGEDEPLPPVTITIPIPIPVPVPVIQPDLRLLEYWEGPGSFKVVGLRNTSQASAAGCFLEIYNNGGTEPWRNIALPEMAAEKTIFLCTSPVERSDCTDPLSTSTFNGNDALVVRCGDLVTDSMGRVGEDPGEAWTDPLQSEITSQDARLWRCGIEADVDPYDPFSIAEDWERVADDQVGGGAFLGCTPGPAGFGGATSG